MPRFSSLRNILLSFACLAALSAAPSEASDDATMLIPIEALKFYQNAQGFSVADGWGDPTSGAHSNFIKMAGGTASGPHRHSFSYYGVVISGVVANEPAGSSADHPLAPGSYWYQRASEPHVTACISQSECLFFVTSKGAFDYLPAD